MSVVFSSPARGILSPPSNIPNTATEYFVPALRGKGSDVNLQQSFADSIRRLDAKMRCPQFELLLSPLIFIVPLYVKLLYVEYAVVRKAYLSSSRTIVLS